LESFVDHGARLIADIQLYDKYARWIPDQQRRETWPEVVERVLTFFQRTLARQGKRLEPALWAQLGMAMAQKDVLPSMRVVQMAGEALDRCHVGAYNCAYLELDSPTALGELLYILMQGTGVGYSVERRATKQWPAVARVELGPTPVRVIEDSTEGWCKALVDTLVWSIDGWDPQWDFSAIRPEGAWLHTKGGRASGPEPLKQLLATAHTLIRNAAGRPLRPFEIHRLATLCGSIVQVGGVRRAAEIALFDADDAEMAACKDGAFWDTYPELAMANNSMVFTGEANPDQIRALVQHLQSVGSGEPGLFRRDGVIPKRREARAFGTNPCLHPDSLIETIHGRMRIADITEPTMVYTMEADGRLGVRPASAAWVSRRGAETHTLTIASGQRVRCTPDHKIFIDGRGWVEARDVRVGDRVVHLVRNRRGAAYSGVKLTSEPPRTARMEHRLVWEAVNGPIPDGWDIHHIDGDTYNNDIDNLECLTHAAHAQLTACEQPNDHQVQDPQGRFVTHPQSRGGSKVVRPMPDDLKSNLHQYATVVRIEVGETVDVYDLTVEGTQNFIADFVVVHNCGEIILRSRQFCNLSIAVARPTDTYQTLVEKVRLAALLGTIQSCLTNFRYLSPAWATNSAEERLLGVDITGTLDCPLLQPNPMLGMILDKLQVEAVHANEEAAQMLGITPSKAVTCNKPSGNSSQLLAASSGIHPRYGAYYVRRLRIGARSPLGLHLQAMGLPVFPEVGQGTLEQARVWVVELPVKAPEGSVTRHHLTAAQQLDYWLQWKRHWTEHNPSCTIYVGREEWADVEAFLLTHWAEIGGLSFLPKDTHTYQLAPYEEISKTDYEARLAQLPASLQLDTIRETLDLTTVAQDYACVGGVCEL
jgi:hypothetical protein